MLLGLTLVAGVLAASPGRQAASAPSVTSTTTAGPSPTPSGPARPHHPPARLDTHLSWHVPLCPSATGGRIGSAPGAGRTVALTFDDGPSPWTPRVLAALARAHVHATFFVIGQHVLAFPQYTAAAEVGGNLVGNHTWDHRYPREVPGGWTAPVLTEEIARTDRAVIAATGRRACFFRPPGGFVPATVVPTAHLLRESVVLWSVDPRDWQVEGGVSAASPARTAALADVIFRRAIDIGHLHHPVILLHDGGGFRAATAMAVPKIINYYRAHGFRFVRMDGRA